MVPSASHQPPAAAAERIAATLQGAAASFRPEAIRAAGDQLDRWGSRRALEGALSVHDWDAYTVLCAYAAAGGRA
jgi:hypothetical protein